MLGEDAPGVPDLGTSCRVEVNRTRVVVLGSRGHVPRLGGKGVAPPAIRGLRHRRIRVACSARTGEMGACRTASDFKGGRGRSGGVVTEVRECRSIEATQLAE